MTTAKTCPVCEGDCMVSAEALAEFESDARALRAVRVLDAWAKRMGMKAPPRPERICDRSGAFLRYEMSNMWGCHHGPTPDAARIAAAEALLVEDPSLGAE